jgi:hypothetical protein
MKSLIIAAPIADAPAVNAELEALGYGPDSLSVRMIGDQPINDEAQFATATHLGCHWVADDETIAVINAIRTTDLATCVVNHESTHDPVGLFNATVGDNVTITHKQFGQQWGWRAEMKVASPDFNPGVRAVVIYSDANHQNYSYTTGAFIDDNGTWATEWNEGKPSKADVHWAVLFASEREVVGTLAANATQSVAFMRFGLPPSVGPVGPTVQPWVQPQGAHDAYALGSKVTHNGFTWQSTIAANVWAPGVFGWVQI